MYTCAVPVELFLSKEAVAAERRYEKERSTCIQAAFRARMFTLTSPPPAPTSNCRDKRGRLALCFLLFENDNLRLMQSVLSPRCILMGSVRMPEQGRGTRGTACGS